MHEESIDQQARPVKRRGCLTRLLRMTATLLVLGAIAFGVWWWGLRIVEGVANRTLARLGIDGVEWRLEEATWGRVRVGETRLRNDTNEVLRLASAEVNWSFRGLLDRRIDRVEIIDVRVPATHEAEKFDLPLIAWMTNTMARLKKTEKEKSSAPWRVGALAANVTLDTNGVVVAETRVALRDDRGTYRLAATTRAAGIVALLDAELGDDGDMAGILTVPRVALPGVVEAQDISLVVSGNIFETRGVADLSTRLVSPKLKDLPLTLAAHVDVTLTDNVVTVAANANVKECDTGVVLNATYDIAADSLHAQGDASCKPLETFGLFAPHIDINVRNWRTEPTGWIRFEQPAGNWCYTNAAGLALSAKGDMSGEGGFTPNERVLELTLAAHNVDCLLPNKTSIKLSFMTSSHKIGVGIDRSVRWHNDFYLRNAACMLTNGMSITNSDWGTLLFGTLSNSTVAAHVTLAADGNACVLPQHFERELAAKLPLVFANVSTPTRIQLPDIELAVGPRETPDFLTVSGFSIQSLGGHLRLTDGAATLGALQAKLNTELPFIVDNQGIRQSEPFYPQALSASALGLTVAVDDIQFAFTNNTLRLATQVALFAATNSASLRADITVELPVDAPERISVRGKIAETTLSDDDPLVVWIKEKAPALTSLSATLGGEASFEMARGRPVISATGFVKNLNAATADWTLEGLETSDINVEIRNTRVRTPGAPSVRFKSITHKSGFTLGPGEAQGRWTGNEGFLERASIDWGGGALRVYAVRFNPAAPKIDTRLYIERVDVGSALALFPAFSAEGTGVLYGEIPISYADKHIHLSEGFLYSPPGEHGKLLFHDPASIGSLLAYAGITGSERDRISESIHHVDFTLLRLDLDAANPDAATLRFRIQGSSLREQYRGTPVNLNLNLNGPLETFLNLGVRMNERLKGK